MSKAKQCTRCGKYKLITSFYNHRGILNGRRKCKTCMNAESKTNKEIKAVIIPTELDHYTPDYAVLIHKLKMSDQAQVYDGELTVGDCK